MDDVSNLGHGVRLQPASHGRMVVISERLPLGWSTPRGRVTGTAVAVDDVVYQVTRVDALPTGERWELAPWPEGEAARSFVTLDRPWVERRAADAAEARRDGRRRVVATPWLVLLGLLPGDVQRRWDAEWGFPAWRATRLSIWAELVVGAILVIQILRVAAREDIWLPMPLALLGPVLVLEGVARLVVSSSNTRPLGSLFGLPFGPLLARKPDRTPPALPAVRRVDAAAGVLELGSPELRRDWESGGRLTFRGDCYRLRGTRQEGRDWVYLFGREEPTDPPTDDTLRLRPAPTRTGLEAPRPSLNVLETTVVTAAVCFAPADQQRRWGARFGTRPVWFTLAGAGAEMIGSLVNLTGATETTSPIMIALDAVIMLDGLGRLVLAAIVQGPVGSVVGWAVAPFIERRLPPDDGVVG